MPLTIFEDFMMTRDFELNIGSFGNFPRNFATEIQTIIRQNEHLQDGHVIPNRIE